MSTGGNANTIYELLFPPKMKVFFKPDYQFIRIKEKEKFWIIPWSYSKQNQD